MDKTEDLMEELTDTKQAKQEKQDMDEKPPKFHRSTVRSAAYKAFGGTY